MPQIQDYANREDYYGAVDAHFARQYGQTEPDCE